MIRRSGACLRDTAFRSFLSVDLHDEAERVRLAEKLAFFSSQLPPQTVFQLEEEVLAEWKSENGSFPQLAMQPANWPLKRMLQHLSPEEPFFCDPQSVAQLLETSEASLRSQRNVRTVSSAKPVVSVVGDLHGSLWDLRKLLSPRMLGWPGANNVFVFNGDFVDRGANSIDVFCFLLCLYLQHPQHVYLNRGNHECSQITRAYTFAHELTERFGTLGERFFDMFTRVFSALPLATLVRDRAFIVHGGITKETYEDITTLTRTKHPSLLRSNKVMEDLTWSDFDFRAKGFRSNKGRGDAGSIYGPDVALDFLQQLDVPLLIRSHECVPDGFETSDLDDHHRIITVFSVADYLGSGNDGAAIKLKPDGSIITFTYSADDEAEEVSEEDQGDDVEDMVYDVLLKRRDELLRLFHEHDAPLVTRTVFNDTVAKVMPEELQEADFHLLLGNAPEELVDWDDVLSVTHSKIDDEDLIASLFFLRKHIRAVFQIIDSNVDGEVTRGEFVLGWEFLRGRFKEFHRISCTPQELFDQLDPEGKGTISLSDLVEIEVS